VTSPWGITLTSKTKKKAAPPRSVKPKAPAQRVQPRTKVTAAKVKAKTKVAPSVSRESRLSQAVKKTLKPVPARAAKARKPALAVGPVRVFQIYYEDWHEQVLDPDFIPYDNRGVESELLEFAVFEALANSASVAGAKLWGAMSIRFSEKTGLAGKEWLTAIAAKPGFDVYYCNPAPGNESIYHNVWLQGVPSHPSFLELTTAFFQAAGLPVSELTSIQPSTRFAAANYFVATPRFWSAYLDFVRKVVDGAEQRLSPKMRALLHSTKADSKGLHSGVTYIPFIVERLFGVFLRTAGAEFKAHKIALAPLEKDLNVHQVLLREM